MICGVRLGHKVGQFGQLCNLWITNQISQITTYICSPDHNVLKPVPKSPGFICQAEGPPPTDHWLDPIWGHFGPTAYVPDST